MAPTMRPAATPPITAEPSWLAVTPNVTTMNATSRPSRTTPLKATTNAVQSNPSPVHSAGSSLGVLRAPARARAARRDPDHAFSNPLQPEAQEQGADDQPERSDRDGGQGCAQRNDEHRQDQE